MGRSGIIVIKYEPVRYDAYSGTPHSAIFQAKPLKMFKSYPGAP
jgi:hypothetical protein